MTCKAFATILACIFLAVVSYAASAGAVPVTLQLIAEYPTGDEENIFNIWFDPATDGAILHVRQSGTRLWRSPLIEGSIVGTGGALLLETPQRIAGAVHPLNGNLLNLELDGEGRRVVREYDRTGMLVPDGLNVELELTGPTSPEYGPESRPPGLGELTIDPFTEDIYIHHEREIQKYNRLGELLEAWNPGNRSGFPVPGSTFGDFAYDPIHDLIFIEADGVSKLYDGQGHFIANTGDQLGILGTIETYSYDPWNNHLYVYFSDAEQFAVYSVIPEPATAMFASILGTLALRRRKAGCVQTNDEQLN